MNEVQAMARAGQTVGAVLGTAVLTARKASVGLSRTSAAASRQVARRAARRLSRRKSPVERLQESLVGSAQRAQAAIADSAHRAQESLAETAHRAQESLVDTRQSLADTVVGSVNKARHELAMRIEPESARGRRRWPWLLAVVAVLGGLAAYVLSRRPQEEAVVAVEPAVEAEPPRVTPATVTEPSGNGVVPQVAGEGDKESEDATSTSPSDGSSR
jgi:hypothetical protein